MGEAMNTMEYKGYLAKIDYGPEIALFCGTVINAAPNTFYGASVGKLQKEFACTMEAYFKFCREKGIEPKKPCSADFNLSIAPELHGQIAASAASSGKNLNRWVANTLRHAVA